ncbi:hypothetical protein MIND_00613500 [Mycena indigotica]|uniref:Arrestin-like N-terminal domain-containing protein n=1 Tax=Mycena indigotica TaxID=2126181 RepID=A0A8H6SSE1_9AGAR|nr:uncharacterized protein MIND_00613500 [Mycena indigotica]KAF7303836.1 hypothetical protein MIND_00613500 [Mycena indigotica]
MNLQAPEALPPSYRPRRLVLQPLPVYVAAGTVPISNSEPDPWPITHPTKEFAYEMKTYWGKPWAKVTVFGDARLSREVPVFLENGFITGSVQLNLKNKEAIKGVYLVVNGDVVTSEDLLPKRVNFLKLRHYVWRRSREQLEVDNTIVGEHTWQFSVRIPQSTDDSVVGADQYRLPHPVVERYSKIGVDYYLEFHVHRGGKLRADDSLGIQFGYFTMQQPKGLSLPRLLAGQTNRTIPGPFEDPEGWKALEPVIITGKTFGMREVKVKCTIFLAKPLCYTRGTAIPCCATFECADEQTLDLFAAMNSSLLYLERQVTCFVDGTSKQVSPCGKTSWRPYPYMSQNTLTGRHLMGELHLHKGLYPSTRVKQFRVDYEVVLFPPDAVVTFVPNTFAPLLTARVEIVTRYAAGVRQSKQPSIPEYSSELRSPPIDRYYRSLS